ncbi:unnamed protein product, partial [Brassica oleracea]
YLLKRRLRGTDPLVCLLRTWRVRLWIRIRVGSVLGGASNRGALAPESYHLCYIDGEGFVFVVDRLKELIKCNGYQVAPAELEALLLAHPDIADAAKSLSKLNIDFAQPKQQVYSKSLRPSFVKVRAMSESQTALKNQPQSSASSDTLLFLLEELPQPWRMLESLSLPKWRRLLISLKWQKSSLMAV